jgi:hypothetical protein
MLQCEPLTTASGASCMEESSAGGMEGHGKQGSEEEWRGWALLVRVAGVGAGVAAGVGVRTRGSVQMSGR